VFRATNKIVEQSQAISGLRAALEHVSAEQNRKVPSRIKGFPRGCLWVILLALILVWRPSDAKLVYCRDA
jgi:hypothetical protein